MPVLGWESAGGVLSELDAEILRSLVLLYNRFRYLNKCVVLFSNTLRELGSLTRDDPGFARASRERDVTIDVFNTGLDSAIEQGRALLPSLLALAKIKPQKEGEGELRDYRAMVDEVFAEREERIKQLSNTK